MANITTENINTLAQLAASIGDGDYIYIFKAGANTFSRIEKSVFMQGASGGISEDDIVANLNSGDNNKVLAASMGAVLKQAITTILNSLSNSAFSTGRPTIVWGVPQTYSITYGTMSHCTGGNATEVTENNPFNVTLVPDNDYTFTANGASVVITMGGVDVTNAYFNKQTGALSIPSVTGNVVISATAAMPVRFTVQATTSHATFDGLTSVGEGESWSGTLTPASGYSLRGDGASVVVNMAGGGTHTITYNNGVATINIPAVTGNVTINATAVVTSDHTISFDLTGCTATGNTTIEDGESATITLKKGSDWSSIASSNGSEYQVPFNKRDILVMNASDNVSLIEGTDYTISQSALDSDIVLTFPSVFANIRIMNIVWGANGIKVVNGEESTDGGSRYAHIETYIPIPTNCRALSIMTNIVTSGNAGVALYNNGKTFASGQNATALKVVNLAWDESEQANHAFLRSSIYSWYKSQKEEEGYYGTIPPGEPTSGNNFEKVVAWCYIYDKTNGRFIWKGEEAATSYVFEHQTLGQ